MVTTRSSTKAAADQPLEQLSHTEDVVSPQQVTQSTAKSARAKKATGAAPTKAQGKAPAKKDAPPELQTLESTTGQVKTILDLPAEIRNDVWSMLVLQQAPIAVAPIRPFVKEPALLAVNRQIRSEAMSIWYAEHDFLIDGSSPAVKFLRSRNDQQLRSMRSLCISSEKSKDMREAPRTWAEHLRKKLETLMREFEPRGLRRKAVKFQIMKESVISWIDGIELQGHEVDGPPDKGKTIRSGPRKGQMVAGQGNGDKAR